MKTVGLLLLLCILAHASPECPVGCKCSRFLHVVRCRDASLQDVPRMASTPLVSMIDLSRNNISELRSGLFLQRNLADVYVLMLYNNNITIVEPEAFRGMSKTLLHLGLGDNENIVLPPTGFNLQALDFLSLTGCNLRNISAEFFKGMPEIVSLLLQNNKLTVFDLDIVAPGTGLSLEELNLGSNELTELPLEMVVLKFDDLFVGGNPFHCDCEFRIAFSVLARERHHYHVDCASPPRFMGVSGTELLAMKLHCDASTSQLVEEEVSWWDLHQWWVLCGAAALVGAVALAACLLYMRGSWDAWRAWWPGSSHTTEGTGQFSLLQDHLDEENVLSE